MTEIGTDWQVLDYVPEEAGGGLADPLQRDPAIRIRQSTEPRPMRNASTSTWCGLPWRSGRRVLVKDRDRTGCVTRTPMATRSTWCRAIRSARGSGPPTGAMFSAMACYRVTSPTQQSNLAAAAAALADETGFPLLVDLRRGLVIIDSALVMDGDEAVAWAEYGTPVELPPPSPQRVRRHQIRGPRLPDHLRVRRQAPPTARRAKLVHYGHTWQGRPHSLRSLGLPIIGCGPDGELVPLGDVELRAIRSPRLDTADRAGRRHRRSARPTRTPRARRQSNSRPCAV